jgi:hypothetical protein
MNIIKRAVRAYRRIDRATGKVRDGVVRGVTRLIKAYRKRNGQRVRAHRRIQSVHYDRHGRRTVKYANPRKIVTVARQGNYKRNAQAGTRRKRA